MKYHKTQITLAGKGALKGLKSFDSGNFGDELFTRDVKRIQPNKWGDEQAIATVYLDSNFSTFSFPCYFRKSSGNRDIEVTYDVTKVEKVDTEPNTTTLVNCTPHPISIDLPDGSRRIIESSGTIPRLTSQTVDLDPIDGIPVSQTILGDVKNLPDPQPGVYLIVSAFVQSACPDRADLLRPDTGPDCVRDEKGRILAVRRLTR